MKRIHMTFIIAFLLLVVFSLCNTVYGEQGYIQLDKYTLTEDMIRDIATCVTGETGGEDYLACLQEVSQMANLHEVYYGKQGRDSNSFYSTLHGGWYSSYSWGNGCTETAINAVREVLVEGHRYLPRYVTEHDMFPLDAAFYNHWYNGNSEDRSWYTRYETEIRQNPRRFNEPATYVFYDFMGSNRDGDVLGYYPRYYEKYKGDDELMTGGLKEIQGIGASGIMDNLGEIINKVNRKEVPVFINGIPLIENYGKAYVDYAGRTMVSLRAFSETLGYNVVWDDLTNGVIIKGNGKTVTFIVGSNEYQNSNGDWILIDTVPINEDGRVFIPIRFAAESLGLSVEWNSENNSVYCK